MKRTEDVQTREPLKSRLLPFLLTALIVAADQITKALVVARFEMYRPVEILGDFLRIDLKRNTAISFSMGHRLPLEVQRVLFLIVPLLVMIFVAVYYFRASDLTRGHRWLLAGILGGGLGNYVDRIFSVQGVVDFIDFKFFGIFGLQRWPTFNIADGTTVVCGILLLVSMIVMEARSRTRSETEKKMEKRT